MKSAIFAAALLVLGGADMASAATATYVGSFVFTAANNAANTASGTFRITFDPSANAVNDLAFDSFTLTAGFANPSLDFTMNALSPTRFDTATAPFSEGSRDFIFGRTGAYPGDTNNTINSATSATPDFRFRANLDSNFDLIAARGSVVNANQRWDFDTASESGTASFTIARVPEPASWALLIAGFGLTGAAMRRRRGQLADA